MKEKIKITEKYLQEIGFEDFNLNEIENPVIKRLALKNEITIDENEERTVVGIISTPDIDSDDEIVLPEAIKLNRYRKNPIVLFNHDLDKPIARATEMKMTENGIEAKTVFGSTPLAQDVFTLMKEGIVRTFSIGFLPIKYFRNGSEEFKFETQKLIARWPNKFTKKMLENVKAIIAQAELFEYSVVSVPANSEAYVTAISSKHLKLDKETYSAFGINEPETVEEVVETVVNETKTIEVVQEPVIEKTENTEIVKEGLTIQDKFKIIGHQEIIEKPKFKIIGHDYSLEIEKALRLSKGKLS